MDERAVATEKEASGLHSFISDVDELLTESEALLDSFDAVPLGAIPAPSPAASNAQYVAAQLDAGAENENERSGDSSSSPAELEPTAATKPAKKKRSRNSTRDREKAELEFFRKQATELAKEVAALRNERETSAQVGNALAPTWRRLADRQLQGKQKAESESKYLKAMVEENANTMKRLWEILTERSKQSSTHCGVLENEQRRCMEWEDSVVLERLKAELAGAYARTDDVIRESGIGRMLDEGVDNQVQQKPKEDVGLSGKIADQPPKEAKASTSNAPVPHPSSDPLLVPPDRTEMSLDETMRFDDLGTVTPPQHAEPVPFPPDLQASLDHFGNMNAPVQEPTIGVFDGDISMVEAPTTPITANAPVIPPAAPKALQLLRRQRLDEAVQHRSVQRQREDHAATLMRTRRRKGHFAEKIEAAVVNSAPRSGRTDPVTKTEVSNSAESDSDCDVVDTKPADTAPVSISEWNARLKLSEIPNPANGHCLYFALRDALHETHPSILQGKDRGEQTERLRATVSTTLLERLEREVHANQIDAAQLFNRYTDSSSQEEHSQEELIDIVGQHLRTAAAVPVSDILPRKYWGGTDELRMTALALDRSIYVLDVQTDGATYLVQYTPVRTFCDGTEDRTTEMRILRDGAATTTFCEEMHHHPCILLCGRGASEASHFTALRSGILRTERSNETDNPDDASANISVQGSNRFPVTPVVGTEVGNSPTLLPQPQQETLNRRRETLLRRMVGTRAEIATLTKAELVIRKQRHSANCAAMDVWAHNNRLKKTHAIPAILHRDVAKLDTLVTGYADALVALLRALPFPLDVLRSFSSKKLIELGNIINSQSQLALIQHHATDDALSAKVRETCTTWASAILGCKQGSIRWCLTDDIARWSWLNKQDASLLTATIEEPIEPVEPIGKEKWAILNVLCRTQKLNSTGGMNSCVKSWKRSSRQNLGVSWLVDVKSAAKRSQIGVKGTAGAFSLGVDRHTTSKHGEPVLSVLSRFDVMSLSTLCTNARRQNSTANPINSTMPTLLDPKGVTGNPLPRPQAVMTDFFASVEPECKADLMRTQFQDHSRKLQSQKRRTKVQRRKMMRHEATIGMHTQNVMGFTKTTNNITAWFNHFRQTDSEGAHDVIFLQETHVEEHEVSKMSAMHSRHWGFDPSQEGGIFSHWSAGSGRKGGVAILRNPYSQVQELKPYKQDLWSPHWMAVTTEFHGETFLLVNIYAPTDRAMREALYQRLAQLPVHHTGPILFGGDFNCTLHPMADRSLQRTALAHDSLSLRTLLRTWGLVDVLQRDIDTASDKRDLPAFHRRHHTYEYTMATGQFESSRLDRWYISMEHDEWIRSTSQCIPGPYSDHNGVSLRVAAPDKIIYVKKSRKVYPVPEYAAEKAEDVAAKFFDTAVDDLESLLASESSLERQAKLAADWWDDAKLRLKLAYLGVKKECASKLRNSYRQKLRRLHEDLRESGTPESVPTFISTESSDGDDLDSTRRSRLIRKQIAECKLKWQEAKALRLRRAHAHHPLRSSKEFFRRISTKFGDNTIYSLGPQKVGSQYTPKALADVMAKGWGPTMQQQQAGVDEIQTYLQQVAPPECEDLLTSLTDPISDEEICAAIKRCKRSKAHGPDELGNDWYRDNEAHLVPLFLILFNLWYSTGVIPDSFRAANIHCIKKSRTAAVPLDHRPIALLNTDYKIYTRVFATRLIPCLPDIVHPLQAGFVSGRSIHTPIDTFSAVQKLAKLNPRLEKVIALLLDFAKAYDSLSRDFLTRVLRLYGFPKQFCDTVEALHSETTCRFLVNGFLSRSIRVTCGIRQGCPLAPLLFIIALDVLYRIIEAMPDFPGVDLECGGIRADLRVSGFADDTAIYLNDSAAIPKVVEVLQRFGDVSGLRVNLSKSICVPLGTTDETRSDATHGIPILRGGDSCRYLGIRVGTSDSSDANWKTCEQALAARLSLAVAKTHSVTQRAEIARAVIVPKVLYIARHAWPSEAVVNKLQRFTKAFVWGKKDGRARKAWLSEEQAELALHDGGISMPSIKTELLTLSAATVARWAANATDFEALIGDILLARGMPQRVYITPSVSLSPVTRTLSSSLWDTGAGIVRQAHALCYTDAETRGIRQCAEILTKGYEGAAWQNGGYYIDVERLMTPDLATLMSTRRKLRGTFCAEWLRCCSTVSDGWLLDKKGTTYNLARAPIARGTTTLQQDLVFSLK
ncbi:reverse transcriptase, partial [Globisporangium splendens]